MIRKKFAAVYLFLPAVMLLLCFRIAGHAREELSILVTSNLEGRFSVEGADQDGSDPMLLLAQSLLAERRKGKVDYYFDLGNAFYPGPLSRYSYGSIMADYFDYFSCDAHLVSAQDLRIGVDNLQYVRTGKKTHFLSSNIIRDKKPVFTPYFIRNKGSSPIAFVGVSSKKIRFDIAEKNLYNIELRNETEAMGETVSSLGKDGVDHIVLLSGLGVKDTIALMGAYRQIQLALCGGDNNGEIYSGRASRIDLADGRAILLLTDGGGFYHLTLQLDSKISAGALRRIEAAASRTDTPAYREFANRLALWKRKFKAEENVVISAADGAEYRINDARLLGMLRERYNAEIAAVDKNTLTETSLRGDIKRSDLLNIINLDYNIFVASLTGDEVKKIMGKDETLVMSGVKAGRIQRYTIEGVRRYRIAATQPAFEKIGVLLEKEIPFRNTWDNVTAAMITDLKEEKALFRENDERIERFFRTTVNFYLSNFIDSSTVTRGGNIETPPGQPETSYRRWGLENKIDITIYNCYHQFIFTPYMLYVRQDQQYLNNLLRGTFVYNYNLHDIIKPYHKSQAETVIKEADGLRPVIIRETAGINAETTTKARIYIRASMGAGFEKKTQDPSEDPVYGVETLINFKFPLLKVFSYSFSLDSFISAQEMKKDERHIRSEIGNTLSVAVNQYLSVSLKHRWFYLWSGLYREKYENSQIVTAADLKTDFKIW